MGHAIEIGPFEDGISPSHVRFVCDEPEGARCRVWCDLGCVTESEHGDNCELRDQGYCGWIEGWYDDAWAWEEFFEGGYIPHRSGPIGFHHHGEDGPTWYYLDSATNQQVRGGE